MSNFASLDKKIKSSQLVNSAIGQKASSLLPNADNSFELEQVISNQASQQFAQTCPLSLPTPNICPYGGICHSCPPRVQSKLRVSEPGDEYEQEADRVADVIIRMQEPESRNSKIPHLSPECGGISNREISLLQETNAISVPEIEYMPDPTPPSGRQSDGGSQPLPESIRKFFELRLGYDFSKVRIHIDTPSTQAFGARAFTKGNHIVFADNQYAPESTPGKLLLAHELTHVIQQTGAQPLLAYSRKPNVQRQCNACTQEGGGLARSFGVSKTNQRIQRQEETGEVKLFTLRGGDPDTCKKGITEDITTCIDRTRTACMVSSAGTGIGVIAGVSLLGGVIGGAMGLSALGAGAIPGAVLGLKAGAAVGAIGATLFGNYLNGICQDRAFAKCREQGRKAMEFCDLKFSGGENTPPTAENPPPNSEKIP